MTAITNPLDVTNLARVEHLARGTQTLLARDGRTNNAALTAGTTLHFDPVAPIHTIVLADLTYTIERRWRAIEFNVSNAAGTSAHHGDIPRVLHEIDTILAAGPLRDDDIILRPHAPDTRATPEIETRSLLLAALLTSTTGHHIHTVGVDEPIPDGPTVITGPIAALTECIRIDATGWTYHGRPIRFFNNPNLAVDLARRLGQSVATVLDQLGATIIHEGALIAAIGLDKHRQQDLCADTGLQSVARTRVSGIDDATATALGMSAIYGGAVVKPDAASGAAGVVIVDHTMTEPDVRTAIAAAATRMQLKYGDGWETTCGNVVYEFINALPVPCSDGPRRWDLRFEVLHTPTACTITPLSARLCPEPAVGPRTAANSIVNQTDRHAGEAPMLTPGALLAALNLSDTVTVEAATSLHRWLAKALT